MLTTVTLDLATLKLLAGGSVTLAIHKVDAATLSLEAQSTIGNRPVYQFRLTSGNKAITDFGEGKVNLQMHYMLGENEQADNVFCVFIDENGQVIRLDDSSSSPCILQRYSRCKSSGS